MRKKNIKISLLLIIIAFCFVCTGFAENVNNIDSGNNTNIEETFIEKIEDEADIPQESEASDSSNNNDNDKVVIDNANNLIKNQPENRFVNNVKVRILDKITGKSSYIESKIGKTEKIDNLEIEFLKCWKSYPEEMPENKLLLKVYENDINTKKKNIIFFGWMFSSSPSLNSLEHQFYDITAVDCQSDSNNSNSAVVKDNNG